MDDDLMGKVRSITPLNDDAKWRDELLNFLNAKLGRIQKNFSPWEEGFIPYASAGNRFAKATSEVVKGFGGFNKSPAGAAVHELWRQGKNHPERFTLFPATQVAVAKSLFDLFAKPASRSLMDLLNQKREPYDLE